VCEDSSQVGVLAGSLGVIHEVMLTCGYVVWVSCGCVVIVLCW